MELLSQFICIHFSYIINTQHQGQKNLSDSDECFACFTVKKESCFLCEENFVIAEWESFFLSSLSWRAGTMIEKQQQAKYENPPDHITQNDS